MMDVRMVGGYGLFVLKKRQKNYKSSMSRDHARCGSGVVSALLRRRDRLVATKEAARIVSTTYEIGPFHLDPGVGVLTQAGVPQALGAQGVAVLTVLVQQADSYVSKAAILDAAWPGRVVGESNLTVQISAIRRVLGQVAGGEQWIETLARRAYRFVGPVVETGAPVSAGRESERSNIPEPLTSFVGRERELVEIKRLLPQTRLLTVVG